jgi:hypothetical protein
MSYPAPPGLNASSKASATSTSTPPLSSSSLPPRPTTSSARHPSYREAFATAPQPQHVSAQSQPSNRGFAGLSFNQLGNQSQNQNSNQPQAWQQHTSSAGARSIPSYGTAAYSAPPQIGYPPGNQRPQQQSQQKYQHHKPQQQHGQQNWGYGQPQASSSVGGQYSSDAGSGAYGQGGYTDPNAEMDAQIAQWQSAYSRQDTIKKDQPGIRPAGGQYPSAGPDSAAQYDANVSVSVAPSAGPSDAKQKTVVRSGGGKTWTDNTLLEWDPAHFRLFVGNLAGEVTDESLHKAFSKYTSVQKARVIRDKTSTKSKGYGFVSFSDGDDYFQAAKEMQGKYIGSHPILLRKAQTEIRQVSQSHGRKGKHGRRDNNNSQALHAREGGGIVKKKANKTKNGLNILG